jgi:hypothetical protein
MSSLNYKKRKFIFWLVGSIFSLILLSAFLYFQEREFKMLELDVKWLVVASVPLLLVILNSNIIKKFKGFGIELETRLHEQVGNIKLIAVDALYDVPGRTKQSVDYLRSMPATERCSIQRLTFQSGLREYYRLEAVKEYLRALPNLKYFEIVNEDGKFIAILSAKSFKTETYIDDIRLQAFLNDLQENSIVDHFGEILVTEKIEDNEDLLEALSKVRRSRFEYLPVVTNDGYLLGVLTPNAIESKIADQVIATYRRK